MGGDTYWQSDTLTTYVNGEYLAKNPGWHIEESPWKAAQVLRMLRENRLSPKSICDVGCGAGEVVRRLQEQLDPGCIFYGYDISPQAMQLCQPKANDRLHFKLADLRHDADKFFDLLLVLDVIEHVEDYWHFLRSLKHYGHHKIFHIPLDISVQTVIRSGGLSKRRRLYNHLHYFTKETALRTLEDTGYTIIDYFYTPRSVDLAATAMEHSLKLPRRLAFTLSRDLAARLLGGFSLLVLTT